MYSDRPILNCEQDELGYDAFAERLVKPLVDWPSEDSVVLGLYGSWGSGKTSALNLLYNRLLGNDSFASKEAIPIRFNPWLYKDTETLLLSFLGTLTTAIKDRPGLSDKDKEELIVAFADMGEALTKIFSLTDEWGGWVGLGSKLAKKFAKYSQKDIFEKKDTAEKILRKIGTKTPGSRVVVLIDDLDRLESTEVRGMLKLVKLIADLPYISYVLSMDEGRVTALLDSKNDGETGRSYLEKIVQLPVHLPEPSRTRLQELVEVSLKEILGGDPFADHRLKYSGFASYEVTIGRRIQTLRDRARFFNSVRFLVGSSSQELEVDTLDMTLVAFLQTFYPDAYQRVRRNREFLTRSRDISQAIQSLMANKNVKEANHKENVYRIVTGSSGLNSDEKFAEFNASIPNNAIDYSIISDVIKIMFPYVFTDIRPSDDQTRIDRRGNRITSPDRFERYFVLQPPLDEISDEKIEELIATLVRGNEDRGQLEEDKIRSLFSPWIEFQLLSRSTIVKLSDQLVDADLQTSLAIGYAAIAFHRSLTFDDFVDLLNNAMIAGTKAAKTTEDHSKVFDLGKNAVEKVNDPLLGVLIAAMYSREQNDLSFSQSDRIRVASIGLSRIQEFLNSGGDIFSIRELQDAVHVIWRWRDLLLVTGNSVDDLRAYLKKLVDMNPTYLPKILSLPAAWGKVPKLDRHQSAADLQVSFDQIFGFTHLVLLAKEYHKKFDQNADPYDLVTQFLKIFSDK